MQVLAEGARNDVGLVRDHHGHDLLDTQIDKPVEAPLQVRDAFTARALRLRPPVRYHRKNRFRWGVEALVARGHLAYATSPCGPPDLINLEDHVGRGYCCCID